MSIIHKIAPSNLLVSEGIRNLRQQICNSCQFKNGKWCGTPIVGNTVNYNGRNIKLCGCIINEKTELKNQNCPAGKW